MNYGINAYRAAGIPRFEPQTQDARPVRQPAEQVTTAASLRPTSHEGLNTDESAMIDRYFPPSEEMSLRIYGPGQGSKQLNPGAVGGRLDLRG